MNDFFVALGFLAEVNSFAGAGKNLNDGYGAPDSAGVSTLSAAVAFVEQHEQIMGLMESLAALVDKDARDLVAMQQEAFEMDSKLASVMEAIREVK